MGLSASSFAHADDVAVATAYVSDHHHTPQHYATTDSSNWQQEVRDLCATSQVQFYKLDGYKNCIGSKQVSYASTDWCPVVKAFCNAQWYPFGGKDLCFTERGCTPE